MLYSPREKKVEKEPERKKGAEVKKDDAGTIGRICTKKHKREGAICACASECNKMTMAIYGLSFAHSNHPDITSCPTPKQEDIKKRKREREEEERCL